VLRRALGDARGAALVEFAALLPVFIALVFGVMQLGQLFWTQSALQHAVEMAARCASINAVTCGTATQIQSYAATQAYGLSLPATTFTATTPACGNQVAASYDFTFPVAALITPAITLTARACYPR
jgi:Flp pilus assembly protein TadG